MSKVNKSILEMLKGTKKDCLPELINYVPTLSSHSSVVKKILNEVLEENKEWKYAICALVSYSIQKWALECRSDLRIDSYSMQYFITHNQESRYFGLDSTSFLEDQKGDMKISETIYAITNKMFLDSNKALTDDEKDILYKLHGGDKTNVSVYYIKKDYKNALTKFCKKTNSKYKSLYQQLIDNQSNMDLDINFVYHDVKTLLDLYAEMKRDGLPYGTDVNLKKAMFSIEKCISVVSSCPIRDSEKMMNVIKMVIAGTSQMNIAKKMNKSQSYVYSLYTQGVKVLSILIWGFSEKAILNMLK